MNRKDPSARAYTYAEFPQFYVWNDGTKQWTPQVCGKCIGRLSSAKLLSGELYYLRMLLYRQRGSNSFVDLRTMNGTLYDGFREACLALGLIDDDNEWIHAIQEASLWATGWQLRHLFASILLSSKLDNPKKLWKTHWRAFSNDFRLRKADDSEFVVRRLMDEELQLKAYEHLETILNRNGRSVAEYLSFLHFNVPENIQCINGDLLGEIDYDARGQYLEFEQLFSGLNEEQLHIYNEIMKSFENSIGSCFFVYGGVELGKTYLWRTLITKLRETQVVLPVASSGIASLLLPGGRTTHSRFKIPLQLDVLSTCNISQQSNLAILLRQTRLIIWDEAPMISKNAFHALDRTLKDLMLSVREDAANFPFGGIIVVLGGDFRQIPPVVIGGNRGDIINTSLLKSTIWQHCKLLTLKRNMRLEIEGETIMQSQHTFAQWLLQVGEGKIEIVPFGDGD